MKLTDYFPIGRCKICRKDIFTPRAWVGLNKDGTYKNTPSTKTCLHPDPPIKPKKPRAVQPETSTHERVDPHYRPTCILERLLDDKRKAVRVLEVLTALNLKVSLYTNGKWFDIVKQ